MHCSRTLQPWAIIQESRKKKVCCLLNNWINAAGNQIPYFMCIVIMYFYISCAELFVHVFWIVDGKPRVSSLKPLNSAPFPNILQLWCIRILRSSFKIKLCSFFKVELVVTNTLLYHFSSDTSRSEMTVGTTPSSTGNCWRCAWVSSLPLRYGGVLLWPYLLWRFLGLHNPPLI